MVYLHLWSVRVKHCLDAAGGDRAVCPGLHSLDDEGQNFQGIYLPWLSEVICAAHINCDRTLKEIVLFFKLT